MSLQHSVVPFRGLNELAPSYDVILCDVWGVLHNGAAAHAAASDALTRYRAGGGAVVLVSNAPRPSFDLVPQLLGLGVLESAWDAIVTSGDVTAHELARRGVTRVHHIGPERDLPIFDVAKAKVVPQEEGEVTVITGLFDDEVETPEDYRPTLQAMLEARRLAICANPDKVVERGDRLIWCAGALADLYGEMGGETLYAGKPFAPIYDTALEVAASILRRPADRSRVLAIGDAVRTDLAGANEAGIDCLFVTSGIHAHELGLPPAPDRLAQLFEPVARPPVAATHGLAWVI